MRVYPVRLARCQAMPDTPPHPAQAARSSAAGSLVPLLMPVTGP